MAREVFDNTTFRSFFLLQFFRHFGHAHKKILLASRTAPLWRDCDLYLRFAGLLFVANRFALGQTGRIRLEHLLILETYGETMLVEMSSFRRAFYA